MEDVAAEPPPRYGVAARLALLWGSLAFGAALLTGLVLAAIPPAEDLSILDTVKLGGLLFFAFNHVAIRMDLPQVSVEDLVGPDAAGIPFGVSVSASIALAMMLGTVLVAWLLYRGGKAVGEAVEGRPSNGLLFGGTVALPYAILSFLAAFLFVFRIPLPPDFPAGEGVLRVGASPAAAFLWPMLIGLVAGVAGSFRVLRGALIPSRFAARVVGAIGGGWRMIVWALAVTFVGLFVLSATNPDTFTGYFRAVGEAGPRGGAALVLFTAFLVPNLMTGLLFIGMGAPIVAGDYLGTSSVTILSLVRWPRDFDAAALEQLGPFAALGGTPELPVTYGIGPIDWFFFVLAPLVGVFLGGRWAALRAHEVTAGGAAAAGALAGVPFALGGLGLSLLAGIGFRAAFGIPFFGGLGRVGPSLVLGTLIAAVWGVAGGALGGLLLGRRPAPVPRPAPPPEEPPSSREPPPTEPPPG